MSDGGWCFRYLDRQQNAKRSRLFSTKELALREACSYRRRGYAITSIEGPGVRMTAADAARGCLSAMIHAPLCQIDPRRGRAGALPLSAAYVRLTEAGAATIHRATTTI